MEEAFAALEQAYADYHRELEECEKNARPTDGILGVGRSEKDDPCHKHADEKIRRTVEELCAAQPTPGAAEEMARLLLLRRDTQEWPPAAQWMLRAMERHALPLIPLLSREAAAEINRAYTARYRRWERLPVQKQICKALKARCTGETE